MRPITQLTPFVLLATASFGQTASDLFTNGTTVLDNTRCIRHLLDIDGDAHGDAIGWWWAPGFNGQMAIVRGYLGNGRGDFDTLWEVTTPNEGGWGINRRASALGDFNGDGQQDFGVLIGSYGHIYTRSGTSAPDYYASIWWPTDSAIWEHRLGMLCTDTNTDTLDDVITATPNGVRLFRNMGPAVDFQLVSYIELDDSESNLLTDRYVEIELGDITGDNVPELFVLHGPSGAVELRVYSTLGGVLTWMETHALSIGEGAHLAMGDVDGDGDNDVSVFGGSGNMHVLRQNTPGTLTLEDPKAGGPATALADINGDGHLDGVCCGGGILIDNPDNDGVSLFHVALGDGLGNFELASIFGGFGSEGLAGVMDVDMDGDMDLVAGRSVLINHKTAGTPYCEATVNSAGWEAATEVTGSASLSRADLTLMGTRMPFATPGLFVVGTGSMQQPLFDGYRCVTAPTRLGVFVTDTGGGNTYQPFDADSHGIQAGDTCYFQAYYRDPAAGLSGANLSRAVRVTFAP